MACFPKLTLYCLVSEAVVWTMLLLTSNEHIVIFRTTTNKDLCDFLWSFSLTSHRKIAASINVTERNILPVLYNINSSTVILLQHQHYIYINIYIYIYINIRNMKPYDGCEITTIYWAAGNP